ncbi:MAG: hypothetical protein B6D53_00230 [Candidatus Omnitrophica bacterium 4484_49]|nr:MAG: hypothetical protein B6D53_00230 [Candidatus Omnitrophica bacterium 4484_49]
MFVYRRIKVGEKELDAFRIKLASKSLIVIVGNKGYIMCGYLDMAVADKFKDVAVRVSGVDTISQVLRAKVESCSKNAHRLGIYKGQPITEVIEIIG